MRDAVTLPGWRAALKAGGTQSLAVSLRTHTMLNSVSPSTTPKIYNPQNLRMCPYLEIVSADIISSDEVMLDEGGP